MTAIRQEAIQMLESIPEDKLSYVVQIMKGINGIIGVSETEKKKDIDNPFKPLAEKEILDELAESRAGYELGEYKDFDDAIDEIGKKYGI